MFWTMKRGLILAGILAVIAAGAWFSRPVYRSWKEQRSLKQAQEFFANQDYRNATLAARQALAANASNVEAARLMANLNEMLRSPEALNWRQRVVDLQPQNLTNRLELAKTALLLGNYPRAGQVLRDVASTNQNNFVFHQLAAMVAIGLNNIGLAERHLSEAARLEPGNKQVQLNRAIIHLQARDQTLVDGALQTLQNLYGDPVYRKDALRNLALAAARNKDFAKAQAFTGELQADANATLEDRLLHLTMLKQGASTNFGSYLAQMEGALAKSPEQVNALTSWLVNNRMADEAARWLESLPDEARSQRPVALALADVFTAQKDWTGLQTLLQEADWGNLNFVRLALLSRAAREERQEIASQANWRAAVKAGSESPKSLTALASMAQGWGWQREQEELLWLLIQRFPGEHWVMKSLNQLYLATGNTRGLHKLSSTQAAYDANDLAAKNNVAALSLLLNQQTARAHELAREVYSRVPTNAVFVSTYAYSLHLQGRTKEGLKAFESLTASQLEIPSIAAYYGVLLVVDGQTEKAGNYFDLAAKGQLLPEEKAMIEEARKSPAR
jgi:predicted Zn-dependent protease